MMLYSQDSPLSWLPRRQQHVRHVAGVLIVKTEWGKDMLRLVIFHPSDGRFQLLVYRTYSTNRCCPSNRQWYLNSFVLFPIYSTVSHWYQGGCSMQYGGFRPALFSSLFQRKLLFQDASWRRWFDTIDEHDKQQRPPSLWLILGNKQIIYNRFEHHNDRGNPYIFPVPLTTQFLKWG